MEHSIHFFSDQKPLKRGKGSNLYQVEQNCIFSILLLSGFIRFFCTRLDNSFNGLFSCRLLVTQSQLGSFSFSYVFFRGCSLKESIFTSWWSESLSQEEEGIYITRV